MTGRQAERRYGVEVESTRQLTELHRLEQRVGVQRIRQWSSEGMPIEAMETPQTVEAFRQWNGTPVPWDVEQKNEQSVQRSTEAASDASPAGDAGVPDTVREVIASQGRSLDPSIQRAMEDRMGDSFGDVRVHTGPKAAQACESIDARAFTVGNHVAFNHGEYDPSSPEGQHVLAHELAHVRQQTQGAVSMLPQEGPALEIDPDPGLEREAEEAAQQAMAGGPVTVSRMGTEVHVQRLDADRRLRELADLSDQPFGRLRRQWRFHVRHLADHEGVQNEAERALKAVEAWVTGDANDRVGELAFPEGYYEQIGASPPPQHLRTASATERVRVHATESDDELLDQLVESNELLDAIDEEVALPDGRRAGDLWQYEFPAERSVVAKGVGYDHAAGIVVAHALADVLAPEAPEDLAFDVADAHVEPPPPGEKGGLARLEGVGERDLGYEVEIGGSTPTPVTDLGPDDVDADAFVRSTAGMILSGNLDLHMGNLRVGDGGVTVIDNDEAGSQNFHRDGFPTSAIGSALRIAAMVGLDVRPEEIVSTIQAQAAAVEEGALRKAVQGRVEQLGESDAIRAIPGENPLLEIQDSVEERTDSLLMNVEDATADEQWWWQADAAYETATEAAGADGSLSSIVEQLPDVDGEARDVAMAIADGDDAATAAVRIAEEFGADPVYAYWDLLNTIRSDALPLPVAAARVIQKEHLD